MEVVASLSQGRTAAAQCGLFTHKSVPVIFEPPCIFRPSGLRLNEVFLIPSKKWQVQLLETKCHLLYINSSPYRAVNTFHHGYRNQPVNDV